MEEVDKDKASRKELDQMFLEELCSYGGAIAMFYAGCTTKQALEEYWRAYPERLLKLLEAKGLDIKK